MREEAFQTKKRHGSSLLKSISFWWRIGHANYSDSRGMRNSLLPMAQGHKKSDTQRIASSISNETF